jgi:hypothetical protein
MRLDMVMGRCPLDDVSRIGEVNLSTDSALGTKR